MRKLFYFSLLFTALLLSSCKSDKEGSNGTSESPTVSNSEVSGQTASDIINSEGQEPLGPITKIKFQSDTYDYGKVMEGKVVEHDYVFTNDGNEPLILKNVKASCGCTTPSWPREPIAPGATGKIHAAFDTNGRGGVGGAVQSKTITVTGNFEGGTVQLTLKGLVDKKADPNTPKPVGPK